MAEEFYFQTFSAVHPLKMGYSIAVKVKIAGKFLDHR